MPAGPETILLFQVALADSLATVEIVRERLLLATAFRARARAHPRPHGGGNAGPPTRSPRDRRRTDRGRRLRRAHRGPRQRRDRRARARVRPDARPARAARQRPQGVRRQRLARAANAAVLDRRIPRAAGGRGTRRRDSPRLHRDDAGPGPAAGEALDRPPRSLPRRRRAADRGSGRRSISAVSCRCSPESSGISPTSTGHELRTAIEDGVWCLGDDARILQIGRALATNAITHTPAGTRVTIRARRRGDRVELVVEDDGPGIPTSQRDAVFSRFYRVEGGMASGSGLGLGDRTGDRARDGR